VQPTSALADHILGLHGIAAAAVVFGLPALEASAFLGFLVPGEIAVLLGGVLAYQHRLSLPVALLAAIAGAIIGDSIGYEVGKHHGRRILGGTLGRIVSDEHIERAERYLVERGGRAVFLGRFTAALRAMIPGLAGMSGLRYRTFLAWNAAGAVTWAGGFVLAGYLAGDSWRHVEHVAGRASVVLLVLVVGGALGARWLSKRRRAGTS
jgi:undecaprenyl-diphosphatase